MYTSAKRTPVKDCCIHFFSFISLSLTFKSQPDLLVRSKVPKMKRSSVALFDALSKGSSVREDSSGTRIRHLSRHLTAAAPTATELNGKAQHAEYRIRQIAWVVKDLEESVKGLCEALGLNPTYRDPDIHLLGLRNCVCVLGDQFLEMVSPEEASNTASKQLERRKGDGGYMVLLQGLNFEADRSRLLQPDMFQSVLTIERDEMKEMHLHPKDTAKCIVSFSEAGPSPREWVWGGPDWKVQSTQSTGLCKGIKAAIIQSDDVNRAVIQYKKLLNVEPTRTGVGQEAIFHLSGLAQQVPGAEPQEIRIVQAKDGRGDGLHGIVLHGSAPSVKGRTVDVRGLQVTFG